MQNVIPLFQRSFSFDQVALIASGDPGGLNPHFARIAADLRSALRERARCVLWDTPVDPMVPGQTFAACQAAVAALGGPESVLINFTGGTKPMSIGAYQAGLASGCQMIYVDTQIEQIYHYVGGVPRAQPFQLDPITVGQVLAVHGKPINDHWTQSKQPAEFEREVTEAVYRARPGSLRQVLLLQNALRPLPAGANGEKTIPADGLEGAGAFVEQFEQAGEARREGAAWFFSPRLVKYLNGDWLEQYVARALSADGRFSDVAGNLQLAGVENELDVACTLNGKLAIVECKSGKLEKGQGAIMVSRLRALKESLAGTFGKTFLVTCYETRQLSARFLDRAGEYVSSVIGIEQLAEVEQVIYEKVALRQR